MNTYEEILLKINSLDELHEKSSDLPPSPYKTKSTDDQRKGDFFELFTKLYLKAKYPGLYSDVWLLSEIPSKDLRKLNLKREDRGIDLLAKYKYGDYVSIQAKYRSSQQRLVLGDIDSFTSYSFASDVKNEYIESGLVVTTSDRPTNDAERPKLKFIERGDLQNFNDWNKIHALINNEKLSPKEIIKPYVFQQEIIDELVEYYSTGGDKAKMILPCGTGKTFISYWIMKTLNPKKILVAAPSIALVKQILDEWNERFIADDKFPSILVICSDDTVKKENDPYVSSVSEIIQETTTDKEKIKKFLNRDDEFQLVISTYQSGEKLIEASKESNTVFDFAIYDEAHRTVGGKNFGALVLDENIKINQKLFMTATEKFFLGNSENDDPLSMDNQEFYGSKTVSRSYKEIIELDESPIIDYKILTLGISKQEILDYWKIDSNILVKYDGKNEGMLRVLSVGILQKKLFEEFGVRLSISFHSALKRAKDLVQIIENLKKSNDYPQLETFFIEGSQNSSVKKNTLNDFSKSQNAIITNARCLTEGVDVRSVDSVIFSDPKSSVIDIVQASGRALRKSKIFTPRKNMPEQKGIIVIPTIVDKEKNLDDLKESESFKRTIDVVKALATQDDRIVEYFRESKKGGGGGIIEYDGFSSAINFTLKEIEEAIHIQAWEKIAKLNWRSFQEARKFVRLLNLKNQNEYLRDWSKSVERPYDIPANPARTYKDKGWQSWGDFLGTGYIANQNRVFISFEESRKFVRSLKLKNLDEWREWAKSREKPDDIPASPDRTYKDKGWQSFGDFLGTGYIANNKRVYRSFEEARKFVRSLKLKEGKAWFEWAKSGEKPDDIPANPAKIYEDKGWESMGDWLGTGKISNFKRVYRTFEEARKFARSLKLQGQREWFEWAKSVERPHDIPANPERTYKDKGWESMGDFLGTGTIASSKRVFRSFEEARKFARSLKLKEGKEWFEWAKSGEKPDDIPAYPAKAYEDKGWQSMGDWLGSRNIHSSKRVFRSFEEARKFARSLKLKKEREWREWAKSGEKPDDIPSTPDKVYKNKGWINWFDYLGNI